MLPRSPGYDWHHTFAAICFSTIVTCPLAGQANGISSLPPTVPTTTVSPSQLPSANPPVTPATQGKADISWDGSTLQISATNMGLNRVLRNIAAKTGLHITGSTPDERIFGTYGPGKLDDVLSDLLDGVAVNVLFVDRIGDKPKELVLTSRTGGPTPPLQSVQNESGDDAAAPIQAQGSQSTDYQPPQGNRGNTGQQDTNAGGAAQPNAVRTPQEIFEQLQRLRSQANSRSQ